MDISDQVLSAFQIEHKEQLERLRSLLAALEKEGAPAADRRWEEAFRVAHTLKGGARVCDLVELERLSHRMESLFSSIRDGGIRFDTKAADTIYLVLDAIEDWMATLAASGTPDHPADALAAIERLLNEATAREHSRGQPPPPTPRQSPPPTADAPEATGEPPAPDEAPARTTPGSPQRPGVADADTVRVRIADLDAVLRSADELFTQTAGHDRTQQELAQLHRMVVSLVGECESVRSTGAAQLRRLGAIPEFAPICRHVESVIQQARRLARAERQTRLIHRGTTWSLGVAADSLRRDIARTRMVTAESIFYALRAMVRHLARDEGKEVEFQLSGLDTIADRHVLQALKDPIMHALRNAIVHGIEMPAERAAAGKPPLGNISLRLASQGSRLELTVEDDGRGIDLAKVAREADRRGLPRSSDGPREATDLLRLLFQPGFTTSQEVSELAGRGMGLSVVQVAVARLEGTAHLRARDGGGTTLAISLPLSISAQRLVLVTAGRQTFAIPTHAIDHLVRIPAGDIRRIEGRPVASVEGSPLPVLRLTELLGLPSAASAAGTLVPLVVIRHDGQRIALAVDSFVAEREALIRELDHPASAAPGFAGAVQLDDGAVALVLNTAQLVQGRHVAPTENTRNESTERSADRPPRVLIVDDSFTTRTLEKSILETNGYDVRVAVDGVEALTRLRSEPIDLVIADVEMPRMDGLTMLKEIKADPRLAHLPVLLVTSLDQREDQERGLSLGAGAYIVKRKFDHQELLATIARFV
jgi:two-component system, chemotaxis family, sensor kinase CheA